MSSYEKSAIVNNELTQNQHDELTYEDPSNYDASSVLKKRRNRSPNHDKMLVPSNMTLRKKAKVDYAQMSKYVKQEKEAPAEEDEMDEKLTFGMQGQQVAGASYLRYEVLEKKGQKVLVPIRYSIRNQNLDTTFHTKEAMQALYEPN